MDKIAIRSTEVLPGGDHYSTLVQLVADVSQDHAHLRTFIYEYARVKLRKELFPLFVEGAWPEIEEQMRGLEAAIDQIETDCAANAPALPFRSNPALPVGTEEQTPGTRVASLNGVPKTTRFGEHGFLTRHGTSSLTTASEPHDRLSPSHLDRHLRSTFWRNTQIIAAAALGVAIYATCDVQSLVNKLGTVKPAQTNSINDVGQQQPAVSIAAPSTSKTNELSSRPPDDVTLPTEYGVYALVNKELIELEQLPIKVPDPRIAISASITAPSRAHVPFGRFRFVIFRRDLTTNAPDRVPVRVVARVVRALTFDSAGHAKTTKVEQSWVIRDNSYQMRVAPYADNPEMIIVTPEPLDFALPAGRYALVLKGIGYDFTVDGSEADPSHCLERAEVLNAPVYSECKP